MKNIPKIDTKPFELYLDLDGVFADFDGGFFKLSNGRWPHQVEKKVLWSIINSVDEFFYELDLMKDAEHLWEYCKQYNPKFLTGLPAKKNGREQKQKWVAEKFGSEWETIVLPKKEKQLHSGPNKVLIDDTMVNIEQWVSKGGHGIFHAGDVWETIAKLEELRNGYAT
jgi:hypothetical protein